MSKLLLRQQEFSALVLRLLTKALTLGYQVTLGDAYRDPRATFPYSRPNSLHASRLALDLNLFVGQKLLTGDDAGQAHRTLHDWWVTVGGSAIIEGDANHYSLPFDGMR